MLDRFIYPNDRFGVRGVFRFIRGAIATTGWCAWIRASAFVLGNEMAAFWFEGTLVLPYIILAVW